MNENLPIEAPAPAVPAPAGSMFSGPELFEYGQRAARLLAASSLLPTAFKGNVADCFILLEIAARLGASPLAVAQSVHVIHGRPSWSGQFGIALVNSCGRYSPLHYDITGQGEAMSCTAWAIEKASGERVEGPPVSMRMAKAEGWLDKPGSKWKTMPELMLRYRAATFFARAYLPEYMLGMKTVDELRDLGDQGGGAAAEVEALLADEGRP